MPGEIASAYVSLIPSFRGGQSAISRELDGPATKAGKASGAKYGEEFASAAAHPLKKLRGVVAGLFVADQVKDFTKDSISAASDLNETVSKTGQIFGSQALPALQRFAAGAASAMGQSKQQALDAADTFAIFGKSAGLNGKKLVGFSTKLTGLASDLSSFHNTSPEQAIEAIGAALRGESEPIRAYGVLLNDASLKAEALRLGLLKPVKDQSKIASAQARLIVAQASYNAVLKKSGKTSIAAIKAQASLGSAQSALAKATDGTIPALTQQQRVLAAQSLIVKQTKDAQGDFARTSSGLANQQRILGAEAKDLEAKLGKGLLPITKKVVSEAAKFVTGIQDGTGAGGEFADVLGHIVKDGRPVVKLIGGVAKHFGDLPGPMKSIVIEGGLLALIWPKITAGAASMSTSVTTRLATVKAEMASLRTEGALTTQTAVKFGAAIKAAAGIGGVLALTQAAGETNQSLATLEKTAGGAALGLSVAGPWGAAVGGAVGLLASLSGGFENAAHKAQQLAYASTMQHWQQKAAVANRTYRDSLNQITGAATRATRASVLQQLQATGSLRYIHQAGISNQELVSALLNQNKAQRLLNTYTAKYHELQKRITNERLAKRLGGELRGYDNAINTLKELTGAHLKTRAAVQKEAIDQGKLNRVLGLTKDQLAKIPKSIVHHFEMKGLAQNRKELRAFVARYGNKSLGTATLVAKLNGIDVSRRQMTRWIAQVTTALSGTQKKASDTGTKTSQNFLQNMVSNLLGPGAVKTTSSLNTLLSGATTTTSRTTAVTGSKKVGKAVTSTLAAQIRAGKPEIVAALDYLFLNLGAGVPAPRRHPAAQPSTTVPHGALPRPTSRIDANGRVATGAPVIQIGTVYAQDVNTFVKAERNRQRRLALGGIGG
jgi:hypothetical protein